MLFASSMVIEDSSSNSNPAEGPSGGVLVQLLELSYIIGSQEGAHPPSRALIAPNSPGPSNNP